MKRLLIASALMVALTGTASADDRDGYKEYRKAQHEAWKDRQEARREYEKDRREAEREYLKDRREAQREYAKDRREEMKEERRRWARGQYIPREYLVDRYYIRDYSEYDLAPPPNGYVWVRPDPRDDRYYLVQLATGIISRILGR